MELSVGNIHLNLHTCFLGNCSLEIWFLKEIISLKKKLKLLQEFNYNFNDFYYQLFFSVIGGDDWFGDPTVGELLNLFLTLTRNDLTPYNPFFLINFFITFCFHEDCHESSGCSIAHTGSRSMHICEYVTPLFCMLNYYFNHFQGNKFFKKAQSNGDVLLG